MYPHVCTNPIDTSIIEEHSEQQVYRPILYRSIINLKKNAKHMEDGRSFGSCRLWPKFIRVAVANYPNHQTKTNC